MTHEEFTDVTFNDLDPSGTRISRSSEFSVLNSTESALNIPHKAKMELDRLPSTVMLPPAVTLTFDLFTRKLN